MKPEDQLKRMEELQKELVRLQKDLFATVDGAIASIPKRLREKRKALGITQEQLSKRIGVSRVQLVNIESKNSGLTLNRFVRLCAALGVSADELIGLREISIQMDPKRGWAKAQ